MVSDISVYQNSWNSLAEIWPTAAKLYNNTVALRDLYHQPHTILSYEELADQIYYFACGLQELGLRQGEKVSLFAENSARWLIADQGIMTAGAIDAVRGSQTPSDELIYILKHSGSSVLIVEDKEVFESLKPYLEDCLVRFVVLLWGDKGDKAPIFDVYTYDQIIVKGMNQTLITIPVTKDNIATIVYTSGTTGKPKGVMLSHGNLIHQINSLYSIDIPLQGDRVLSILPTWHTYERSCEYFLLARGCHQIYTNLSKFKQDIQEYNPHYLIGVPRLWESIHDGIRKEIKKQPSVMQTFVNLVFSSSKSYIKAKRLIMGTDIENLNPSKTDLFAAFIKAGLFRPLHKLAGNIIYSKIRKALGNSLKLGISGGGSLAKNIEDFFEIIGIEILVGYGLSESSPILTARIKARNIRNTVGQILPLTQIRIVDPENLRPVPPLHAGLILAKGPQVMQGYYLDQEATLKVLDSQGWLNTGDIGWLTPQNDLVITGRAKDIIVLSSGENIEPQPIEDACLQSPFIRQIILVGQDQQNLGALIIPDFDILEEWTNKHHPHLESLITNFNYPAIQKLFRNELTKHVQNRPNFRPNEHIKQFLILTEPFTLENGLLTQTLKIRRNIVLTRYKDIIDKMYNN